MEYSTSGRLSECIESTSHGGSDLMVSMLSCLGDLIRFFESTSCFETPESIFDGEKGPEERVDSKTSR